MKVIILAGGMGTRIASVMDGKPKVLAEVRGKPILEHQIVSLRRHGLYDIRLSLGYKADEIIDFCERKWPGEIEFVTEPKPLGTGGAVKFASRDLLEDFLVVNGDLLSDLDVTQFLTRGANAMACSFIEDARDFGLLRIEDGKVRQYLEKPKEKVGGYINGGFYLLKPEAVQAVREEAFMLEREVFPMLAERGELKAFLHDGKWIDVGTKERWEQANNEWV